MSSSNLDVGSQSPFFQPQTPEKDKIVEKRSDKPEQPKKTRGHSIHVVKDEKTHESTDRILSEISEPHVGKDIKAIGAKVGSHIKDLGQAVVTGFTKIGKKRHHFEKDMGLEIKKRSESIAVLKSKMEALEKAFNEKKTSLSNRKMQIEGENEELKKRLENCEAFIRTNLATKEQLKDEMQRTDSQLNSNQEELKDIESQLSQVTQSQLDDQSELQSKMDQIGWEISDLKELQDEQIAEVGKRYHAEVKGSVVLDSLESESVKNRIRLDLRHAGSIIEAMLSSSSPKKLAIGDYGKLKMVDRSGGFLRMGVSKASKNAFQKVLEICARARKEGIKEFELDNGEKITPEEMLERFETHDWVKAVIKNNKSLAVKFYELKNEEISPSRARLDAMHVGSIIDKMLGGIDPQLKLVIGENGKLRTVARKEHFVGTGTSKASRDALKYVLDVCERFKFHGFEEISLDSGRKITVKKLLQELEENDWASAVLDNNKILRQKYDSLVGEVPQEIRKDQYQSKIEHLANLVKELDTEKMERNKKIIFKGGEFYLVDLESGPKSRAGTSKLARRTFYEALKLLREACDAGVENYTSRGGKESLGGLLEKITSERYLWGSHIIANNPGLAKEAVSTYYAVEEMQVNADNVRICNFLPKCEKALAAMGRVFKDPENIKLEKGLTLQSIRQRFIPKFYHAVRSYEEIIRDPKAFIDKAKGPISLGKTATDAEKEIALKKLKQEAIAELREGKASRRIAEIYRDTTSMQFVKEDLEGIMIKDFCSKCNQEIQKHPHLRSELKAESDVLYNLIREQLKPGKARDWDALQKAIENMAVFVQKHKINPVEQ